MRVHLASAPHQPAPLGASQLGLERARGAASEQQRALDQRVSRRAGYELDFHMRKLLALRLVASRLQASQLTNSRFRKPR